MAKRASVSRASLPKPPVGAAYRVHVDLEAPPMSDEPRGPEAPWIRSYFQKFSVRPSMFFEDRRARSVYLWTLGYRWSREDLGYPEYGHGEESLLADFCAWLARRTGLVGVDWIHHIENIDASPDNAATLFKLFDEFLQAADLRG